MDMLRVQLQIHSLSQIELDTISKEGHDQLSGTNDVMHGGRNELKRENDVFSNRYYPLWCPKSKVPSRYHL